MSIVPQESIHAMLHRRLSELESAIELARAALKEMEDERDLASKIIRENRLQKSGPTQQEGTRQQEGDSGSAANGATDGRGAGGMTIKQMALAVLADHPDGLSNSGIFEAIRSRFGQEIQPKSLSPQLGRLADRDNKIVKENGVWKLAEKNAG
ncbi:hypothetical protein [Devosia sp. RR2S18]|uniref:hypothetical protein n=1 Tax=Devosia rhizosphaerae TaxID=3049774 RepID=UPI002541C27B|nr:hypothetical protein [Devosia sp. RR2S18]WIJ24813.1 hypothetical protein QOV41_17655 [Devosia sp. RR2S18]WIJ24839.1 hypothetical protein QOV41_17800 [Devosia sp. RR2S18]